MLKNGKRPTRAQKLLMVQRGLDPGEWLVHKALPGELHLVHRSVDGKTKVVKV